MGLAVNAYIVENKLASSERNAVMGIVANRCWIIKMQVHRHVLGEGG